MLVVRTIITVLFRLISLNVLNMDSARRTLVRFQSAMSIILSPPDSLWQRLLWQPASRSHKNSCNILRRLGSAGVSFQAFTVQGSLRIESARKWSVNNETVVSKTTTF